MRTWTLDEATASLPWVRSLVQRMRAVVSQARDQVAQKMYELGAIILPCGTRGLRFRTPLDVTIAELDEALDLVRRAVDQASLRSA